MVHITVSKDSGLDLTMEGLDKVLTLKSKLHIPIEHVTGATVVTDALDMPKGLKLGGSGVPGVIRAGTFTQHGDKTFWDVHDAGKAVMIDLQDDKFAHLVVEVADPVADTERINSCIG